MERWERRLERERRSATFRSLVTRYNGSTVIVAAPPSLSVNHNFIAELLDFLQRLRDACNEAEFETVIVDFRRTRATVAGGTMLVYSELQRLRMMFPELRLRCRASRAHLVNEVLTHLGIFKLLSHTSNVQPRHRSVVLWKHCGADEVDCTGAGKIIETYDSLESSVSRLLFKGVSEAVANVIAHAYDFARNDGLPEPKRKSWWMFCREDGPEFMSVVCDLGAGIPNTLEKKNPVEMVASFIARYTRGESARDADLIEAAMELARTRTRNEFQGLGLQDFKAIVDLVPKAELHIYSNSGCLVYKHGKSAYKRDLPSSIGGTLVLWKVPTG